jgi:hypothetical protein
LENLNRTGRQLQKKDNEIRSFGIMKWSATFLAVALPVEVAKEVETATRKVLKEILLEEEL